MIYRDYKMLDREVDQNFLLALEFGLKAVALQLVADRLGECYESRVASYGVTACQIVAAISWKSFTGPYPDGIP